jgi:hypothetical protein
MAVYKANNTIGKLYKGSNQIGKGYKGGTLVYTAEEKLADLTAGGDFETSYAITGIPNKKAATSGSYWNLSGYDYLRGDFSNTIEQVSWGSGGGSFSNGTLHTYLKFNDGTTKWLFDGSWKTFTETEPIDLTGYTNTQKSKVYLYSTRDIDIPNATNTYTTGEGKATNCIAY